MSTKGLSACRFWALRLFAVACVALFHITLVVPLPSHADTDHIIDQGDYLTLAQEETLEPVIVETIDKHGHDIVVAFSDFGSEAPQEVAERFYDEGGFGIGPKKTGILLLVSPTTGHWHIATAGDSIDIFTDSVLAVMAEAFVPPLEEGDYYRAANVFVIQADIYLSQDRDNSSQSADGASATGRKARVVDELGKLTAEQKSSLESRIFQVSEKYEQDIVILFADGGGISPEVVADDYYDYNGYGIGPSRDGVLLFLDPVNRDWYLSTTGKSIKVFTDNGIDKVLGPAIKVPLKDNDWYGGATVFVDECERFMEAEANGKAITGLEFTTLQTIIIWVFAIIGGLLGGFIAALFVVENVFMNPLKNEGRLADARDYAIPRSLQITGGHDKFVRRAVQRVRRQTESSSGGYSGSSTHTSSSGTTHGGGGGKF